MLIERELAESVEVKKKAQETMSESLEESGQAIIGALQKGGAILICGNGGSAADAQHFAAELINRYEKERRPLPAIALTTDSSNLTSIANDYSYDEVFSKQVEALGKPNDLLVAISTSGNSISINKAVEVALRKGMKVIILTGEVGGKAREFTHENLLFVQAPSQRTSRIQEVHILVIHIWCGLIDEVFA